jgi:hypothetical protein
MPAQALPNPPLGDPRDRVVADHVYLRKMLDWLERAEDDESLAFLLEELAHYLPEHFASEEKPGGLFVAVVRDAPRLAPLATRLREQHGDILAMLDRLREDCGHDLAAPCSELRHRVDALVVVLRDHEAEESLMLSDAVGAELEEGP